MKIKPRNMWSCLFCKFDVGRHVDVRRLGGELRAGMAVWAERGLAAEMRPGDWAERGQNQCRVVRPQRRRAGLPEEMGVRPRLVLGDVLGTAAVGQGLDLPDGAVRHLQVLRMQPGDEVWVLDGVGGGWVAEVAEMGRKSASVTLVAPLVRDVELPLRVSLVVGVPANDRMDALVEKATELGAWAVHPVLCERAVWRADGARADKKVAHWQGVAQAAAEQSGRMVMPQVQALRSLGSWLQGLQGLGLDAWFVLDPRAARSWGDEMRVRLGRGASVGASASAGAGADAGTASAHANGRSRTQEAAEGGDCAGTVRHWAFVSGPEGGLTDDEVQACVAAGATAVRLGPRILRADTAPLAVLASLGSELER